MKHIAIALLILSATIISFACSKNEESGQPTTYSERIVGKWEEIGETNFWMFDQNGTGWTGIGEADSQHDIFRWNISGKTLTTAFLKTDGAKDSDLKGIKADTSFVGLTKLAIDMADGVIQGSETINQDVLDYIATKKDTPFLPYQSPETYMDAFNEFYDVVLDSK